MYEELIRSCRACATGYVGNCDSCMFSGEDCYKQLHKASADAIEEMMYIAKAKNDGKILILNDKIALAMAAGAMAIRGNKRLTETTYVYDVFGKDGGPYEINYHDASETLTTIWNAYPLPWPPKEET